MTLGTRQIGISGKKINDSYPLFLTQATYALQWKGFARLDKSSLMGLYIQADLTNKPTGEITRIAVVLRLKQFSVSEAGNNLHNSDIHSFS